MDLVLDDIAAPTQPTAGSRAVVRAFTLSALDAAGQPVTQFSRPLTLVVTYTNQELGERGISEDTLNVAYWDGAAWASLLPCEGCGIDLANNRATAVVDHLTEFALTGSAQLFLPNVQSP
jgi:hypothetical protein